MPGMSDRKVTRPAPALSHASQLEAARARPRSKNHSSATKISRTKPDDTLYGTMKDDGKTGNDELEAGKGKRHTERRRGRRPDLGRCVVHAGLRHGPPGRADVFVFVKADGNDVIHAFDNGLDVIQVTASAGATSFAVLTISTATAPNNVLIQYGARGDSVELVGLNVANIDANDFQFV